MTNKLRFLSPAQAEILRDWWYALQPRGENDPPARPEFSMFSRGDRAELRRCTDPDQVLLVGAFMRLAKRMLALEAGKPVPRFKDDASVYALAAGILAHVATDLKDESSFAALLGKPGEGDRPGMSALRFARLQTAFAEADFFQLARRAVHLVGKKADVVQLADELLAWVWEFRGNQPDKPRDRLRVRWATDYFSAANKLEAPSTEP
jgi:CRISPR system Cascade subunit CasB